MPKTICLYHRACWDGLAACWAARRKLGTGPEMSYIPAQYGDPLPPEITGAGDTHPVIDTVFMLDFSTDRETTEAIAARMARRVVVLDHHASAEKALAGLDGRPGLRVVFDMEKSGAVLAWEYFHAGQPMPKVLSYIQDRDIWIWKLPYSREISACLASHPKSFETIDHFAEEMTYDVFLNEMVAEGSAILRYQAQIVDSLAYRARPTLVGGHTVPGVNSACLQSEIGNRILEKDGLAKFACVWFVTGEGDTVYSLRGRGNFDVSIVAKEMGGGGHFSSAGFTVKRGESQQSVRAMVIAGEGKEATHDRC
jgi:nanoRNase/pAp phosphatase (c-di-AMP/oligoRNAs hydrolase)